MIQLTDREWKPFFIGEIFDKIEPGKAKGHNHLQHDPKGVSYIGATNRNNGVLDFVSPTAAQQAGNAIGFIKNGNGIGSAGHAIYKAEAFMSTSDVVYGYAKWLNRHVGLFFTTCSDMNQAKFSHGYKWTPDRIKRSQVTLPVREDGGGEPDYAFMEAFVKEREEALLARYKAFVDDAQSPVRGGVEALSEAKWQAFPLTSVFNLNATKSGIDKNKLLNGMGRVPYITRSDINNGISLFVAEKQRDKYRRDEGGVITIGLDTQTVFYQPHSFYTGQNLQVLSCKGMTQYAALVICRLLKVQMGRFNWGGNGATLGRLKRSKLMLPATPDGKPDFAYMDAYGREVMRERLSRYLAYRA